MKAGAGTSSWQPGGIQHVAGVRCLLNEWRISLNCAQVSKLHMFLIYTTRIILMYFLDDWNED